LFTNRNHFDTIFYMQKKYLGSVIIMRFPQKTWVAILMVIFLIGCSQSGDNENGEINEIDNHVVEIYTSLYPLQYVTEKIGGNTVTVHSILPPGADAHTYEPTSKEIISIAKGDLFFYLGAGMEAYAETVAQSLASQDVRLVEIGEDETLFIKDEHEHDEHGSGHNEHGHGDLDPHIWLDPIRLVQIAEIVKDELITINPDADEIYEENYQVLITELTALDQSFQDMINKKKNKHILVSHAAYGYWEDKYGIEQISVNGLSSSSEPSQKELTSIIHQTKEYALKYILFEENTSNRVSEIIQDEIGAEAAIIHNLEVLTEDDIKNNEDYLSIMQSNLETLDKVLQ